MNEFLSELLKAVILAAIPVLTTYLVKLINKLRDRATAQTDDIKKQGYITEIADAVSTAVATVSQTYVDGLKKANSFTVDAQQEAAQKALNACLSSLSTAAITFIETVYGDVTEYLANRIEAEVRKQKQNAPVYVGEAVLETTTDATAIAASTAAATAATIAQTAIQQLSAEPTVPEGAA